MKKSIVWVVMGVMGAALMGCSSAQKQTPHMGYSGVSVEAQIGRDDLVVLDRVEGSSTSTSILLGLVQIIDGDKVKVLGIPFFTDKYTYFQDRLPLVGAILGASALDRAYYKALEKHPAADVVLVKSYDLETNGIPLLFSGEVVTVRGKAVALRADQ